MSSASLTASLLVRAARMSESDNDFENLLQTTRRAFRPNLITKKAGRRRSKDIKRTVILVRRSNTDFLPSTTEIEFLTDRGLGKVKDALFSRKWSAVQIEQHIINLYSQVPLDLVGFKYLRIKKNRQLEVIENVQNAVELFEKLNQGMLVIMPNRDLPLPTISVLASTSDLVNAASGIVSESMYNDSQISHNPGMSQRSNARIERQHVSGDVDTQLSRNAHHRETDVLPQSRLRSNTGNYYTENKHTESSQSSSNIQAEERIVTPHIDNTHIQRNIRRRALENIGLEDVTTTDAIADRLSESSFQTTDNWEIEMSGDAFSIFNLPTLDENAEILPIYISRHECTQEMIGLYQDEGITNKKLVVEFLGETGTDVGGLTRELFSLFWKKIELTHFDGDDCIMPFLPLHRIKKEADTFTILGRIFSHMLLLTGTVPAKISRSLYLSLADIPVSSNILQEDFLLFVSPVERLILKKALFDYKNLTKFDKETLANIFASHHYYDNPNELDLPEQLNTIANQILVERPKVLINKFKNGIPDYILNRFWKQCTAESITYLLASYRPTTKKILECLHSSEFLTNEQSTILHYLHMFIGSLNKEELLEFLFFVTGSYSIHFDAKISITFNTLKGQLRRPISHTCNNVLELSTAYNSFQDFKNEMNMYLKCIYSYEYTQA